MARRRQRIVRVVEGYDTVEPELGCGHYRHRKLWPWDEVDVGLMKRYGDDAQRWCKVCRRYIRRDACGRRRLRTAAP
jgi:hypothetical protein